MPNSKYAENVISAYDLNLFVSHLADSLCEGRAAGTRGSVEAAQKIIKRFNKYGLVPAEKGYTQSFLLPSIYRNKEEKTKVGRNIIGFLPCSKSCKKDKYIIITAHYDHLGILNKKMFPGADKNASGVAALVELAHMMSTMKKLGRAYYANILFVALDGKENNMAGSKKLCSSILNEELLNPISKKPIKKKEILTLVNIDQIGSTMSPLKSKRKDYLIFLPGKNKDFCSKLVYCNEMKNIRLELGFDYYGSKDFTKLFYRKLSDQKVFLDNGINSVMFTSGITMHNNKVYDTPDTLDYDILRKRIILIFYWLQKLAF